jgi:hypothetical protein
MYRNILNMSLEELEEKVRSDSDIRCSRIQAMAKITIAPKSRAPTQRLTDEEKLLLKVLGITPRTLKSLRQQTGESS